MTEITATAVTTRLVRGTTVVWEHQAEIDAGDVTAALQSTWNSAPPAWPPYRTDAIVGTHASAVKQLRGLPSELSSRQLAQFVDDRAEQFFARRAPYYTTSALPQEQGNAIAGVIDADIVEAIVSASRESGIRLGRISPNGDPRLYILPTTLHSGPPEVSQTRAILARTACALAAIGLILLPPLLARRAAARDTRTLTALASADRRRVEAEQDAASAQQIVDRVARFESERRPIGMLLAAVSRGLPTETAMTTLRVDSASVDLVILSTRAAAALGALDRIPGIVAPEIVGPVSKEAVGPRTLERATVRFKYDPTKITPSPRVAYDVARGDDAP